MKFQAGLCLLMLGLSLFAAEPADQNRFNDNKRQVIIRVLNDLDEPITGLDKDRFLLEVDGKKITDFQFHESGFEPLGLDSDRAQHQALHGENPAGAPRLVVLFLDSRLLGKNGFNTFVEVMSAFIDKLGPNDLARIYTSGRHLTTLSPFTADKEVLKAALANAEMNQSSLNDLRGVERLGTGPGSDGGSSYGQKFEEFVKEERKNRQADQFLTHLETVADTLEPANGDKIFYLFTRGFPSKNDNQHSLNKVAKRMAGAGIALHCLTSRGDVSERLPSNISPAELTIGPSALAGQTGGAFVIAENGRQSDAVAQELFDRTANYYVLTYQGEDTHEKVSVEIANADRTTTRVLYGDNREHGTSYAKMRKGAREDMFEMCMAYGAPTWELDADIDLYHFQTKEQSRIYTLHGRINGAQPGKNYRLGWQATNAKNEIIASGRVGLKVPKKADNFVFYDLLVLDQAPVAVRYFLRDEDTGACNLYDHIISDNENGPGVSSLVVFQQAKSQALPLYKGRKGADYKSLEKADPFVNEGRRLHIVKKDAFSKNEPIWVLFYLQNLERPVNEYRINGFLEINGQKQPIALNMAEFGALDANNYRVLGQLQDNSLLDPESKLIVEITDPSTQQSGAESITFEVLN